MELYGPTKYHKKFEMREAEYGSEMEIRLSGRI